MARLPVELLSAGNRSELPSAQPSVEKTTPDNFGGQVARSISGLGDAGFDLAAKIAANEQKSAAFSTESGWMKVKEDESIEYEQNKRNISGSAEGWWQTARNTTAARVNAWVQALPERVRPEYQAKADQLIKGRTEQAFGDQYQQQDTNTKQTLTEEQRKAGAQVQANPQTYEQYRDQQITLIDKSTLPPAEREKLKADVRNSLAYVAETSRAQKNPESVYGESIPAGAEGVRALIKQKEGFRAVPYDDRTALRVGYGSDTITKADGTVERVTASTRVTQADAERDLDRRISTEFQPAAERAIGKANFDRLSPAAQAVMVSLSYNYGAGAWGRSADGESGGRLSGVARAAKSGDTSALVAAVQGLAGDNAGVNASRRASEAAMIAGGKLSGAPPSAASAALTPAQRAVVSEAAERALASKMEAATAATQAATDAQRNALYMEIYKGPAPAQALELGKKGGLLNDVSQLQRAEKLLEERTKGDEDYRTGAALMGGGKNVANPFDKAHKDGVSTYYDRGLANGADPAKLASRIFDTTGMVVPQLGTTIRKATISQDKATLAAGLGAAAEMLRTSPNAFAGVEGGAEMKAAAIEFMSQTTGSNNDPGLGRPPEVAAQKIIDDARDLTTADPVKSEARTQFAKDYLSREKIDGRLSSNMSSWFALVNGQPWSAKVPDGKQGEAFAGFYRKLAEDGFRNTRNANSALAFADAEFQSKVGVQGGVLTFFPPDKANLGRVVGTSGNGTGWTNEQAASEASAFLGRPVAPDQVIMMPIERRGVSTSTAFSNGGETVQRSDGRPDQRTSFRSVPYQLAVKPKVPGDALEALPNVFYPDIENYVADTNKKRADTNAAAGPITEQTTTGETIERAPHQYRTLETPTMRAAREKEELGARMDAAQTAARAHQAAAVQVRGVQEGDAAQRAARGAQDSTPLARRSRGAQDAEARRQADRERSDGT